LASKDGVKVACQKENKEWKAGPFPTIFKTLYVIDLISAEQKQIPFQRRV